MTKLYVCAKNRFTAFFCSPIAYYIWVMLLSTGCQIPNNLFSDLSSGSSSQSEVYAYVTDSSEDGNVYQCAVNPETGLLSSCAVTNGGVNAWSPRKIILRNLGEGTVAYVADNGGNNVPGFYGNIYLCQIEPYTGDLADCTPTNGGMSSWNPFTIGISTQGENTFAYVSGGNENVYRCLIDSADGTLGDCALSNGGYSFWTPSGVSLENFAGGTLAYFADTNGEVSGFGVVACAVNAFNGDLSGCAKANTGTGDEGFSDVGLLSFGNKTFAYLVDTNSVRVCAVNSSTGALSSCVSNTGGVIDWQPLSITLTTIGSNSFAYVSDGFRMYACPVNETTGNLGTCQETEFDLPWNPTSIAIQQ
jgi:hypothetical protein